MPRSIPPVLDNRRAGRPARNRTISGFLFLPLTVLVLIHVIHGATACAQPESKSAGASSGQVRLALVPLASGESLPPEFSALLAVDLSQSPDVALLERERVDRILKEQALSLSLGSEDRGNLVKAGQILAADALLMLAMDKKDNALESMLRVRLVETRQGFKLLDWNLAFPADVGKFEETAKTLANRTRQYLAAIQGDPGSRLMMGVSSFTSDELSKRWDWLAQAIPPALEQNLLLYPGVILMERFAAKPLMDERDLARDLPESIRASAILINGSYRIVNQNETLEMTAVTRRGGREVFREKVQGPVSSYEAVCAQAARAILAKLRSRPVEPSMDAEAEAAMLVAEVERLIARGEGALALPIAESAAALTPNSLKCQIVLQKALVCTMLPLREPGMVAQSFPRLGAITSRIVSLATPTESVLAIQELLNLARNVLEWFDRQPAMADSYREVRLLQQRFYRIGLQILTDKGFADRLLIIPYADIAHSLTLEEAMNLAAEIEADRPKWRQRNAISPLGGVVTAMQRWKDDAEACRKGEAFLAGFCESSDMDVKFEALKALEYYYQEIRRDYPQVRATARRILDTQKSLGAVNPPSFAYVKYSADRQESRRFEAELLAEAFAFIYEESKKSNPPTPGLFVQDQLFYVVNLLEEVGRKEDAKKWLNLSLASYGDWRGEYRRQIQERLLLLEGKPLDVREKNTQEPTPALIPKRLLTVPGLPDGMTFFRRMLIQGGEIILVVWPVSNTEYRLMRFDRKTLAVRSVRVANKPIEEGPQIEQERWYGPAVAMHHNDVFLGIPDAGILVFRANGASECWTEKKGLACQRVRDLQSLGDLLFAHVGSSGLDSGLMEIDPLTGESRMLLSSKSVGQSEFDGRSVRSIQADPARGLLWVLLAETGQGSLKSDQLYQYDPRTTAFQRAGTNIPQEALLDFVQFGCSHRMRFFGNRLLICGPRGICQLNVDTKQAAILRCKTDAGYSGQWKFDWEFRLDTAMTMRTNVLAGENLVTHEGYRLLIFYPSSQSPVLLDVARFDGEKGGYLSVRDLIPAPEGLYVLTSAALYRIEGLQGPPIGKDEVLVP